MPAIQLLDLTSYGNSPFALPIGAVAVLSISVGSWVAIRERGRQVSLSFLATTLAAAVYLGGFAMMVGAANARLALWWGKFAYVGIPFIVPAVYHFSVHLIGNGDRRRNVVRSAWAIGALYALLTLGTDVLLPGVRRETWGYITRLTLWNLPVFAWYAVLFWIALRDYIRAYREAVGVQKERIRWFAIPLVIACAAFIDYLPSFGLPLEPWGFVFLPVFLLSAAVAVQRYHLPDLTPAFAADQIIATMADPLLVCEPGGRITIANRAAGDLLGYRDPELKGRHLAVLFGPHSADSLLRSNVAERELVMYARLGDAIDVSVSTGRLTGPSGNAIGTVVVARDIRERKRAAEALVRREQHYRALIENAIDTITVLDATGRIRYQSPSVQQVLGYDPEADVGVDIFSRIPPEDRPRVLELFGRLVANPGGSVETETRVRHADGSLRTFEIRGRNLLDNRAVEGIVLNGRDVTEERQLEAQLRQAQKMEAIGRLAGGVAHDFNNILTAIQGNIALMHEEVEPGSRLAPELEEVRRGAERAARLTDQLLTFSRRQVVRPQLVDLNEVVLDVRSMLERLIGEDIRLETDVAAKLRPVRADRGHLEQVLLNLVVNARDSMEGGGRITLSTRQIRLTERDIGPLDYQVEAGEYVLLVVQDEGTGMDAATRSRIFEPFFTTKDQGKGTGLGLSTVYGTVRQSGGYVGVDSEPGRGSRFLVYLPVADADAVPDPPPASAAGADGGGGPPETGGETVLVVEDEVPVRALVRKILTRRGYTVLDAGDGERALEVADSYDGTIHLLIADLVMPGMSGRQVAERLTRIRPGLKTIFVSGYTADEVIRRGIVSGEHVFLPKPFTPAALESRVRDVLGRSDEVA